MVSLSSPAQTPASEQLRLSSALPPETVAEAGTLSLPLGGGLLVNVAVTDFAALIVTSQLPAPVHAPDQPANVEPAAAVAVSVTSVPSLYSEAHAPAPLPVLHCTVPLPVPAFVIVRGNLTGVVLNHAVTDVAALIVTSQLPMPGQAPGCPETLQPAKVEPGSALAVSVTLVPAGYLAAHAPALHCTVPLPLPAFVIVRGYSVTTVRLNVAVTFIAAVIVTSQAPVPVHASDQPANVEPAAGVSVRLTLVPSLYSAAHAPAPLPLLHSTVPLPVPAFVTVSGNLGVAERLNVAVTFIAAVIVTSQAPVPVHASDQPANVEPAAGVSVRLTLVPSLYSAAHAPAPLPVLHSTVPVPVPTYVTVRGYLVASVRLNVAVTDSAALIFPSQLPVPGQALGCPATLQPANVELKLGVAVSSTLVPS